MNGTYVCGCTWRGTVVPHYCPAHKSPIILEIRGRMSRGEFLDRHVTRAGKAWLIFALVALSAFIITILATR